jgi:hypothetical protein
VILHRNYVRATAWEKMRIAAMMKGGCILTLYRRDRGLAVPPSGKIECQHIVRDNKRLGHLYTIPLHAYYHQGRVPLGYDPRDARAAFGATLKDSMRVFRESHGVDDLDLWILLQKSMGMSTDLPPSKIVPRKLPQADVARPISQE